MRAIRPSEPRFALAGRSPTGITVAIATTIWLLTWLFGNLVGGAILAAAGRSGGGSQPVWVNVVGAASLWVPMLAGLWFVSRRDGAGSFVTDFRLRFQPIDVLGVPIGVLCQLVLLRLAYWPLERWWPGMFGRERVERTARELSDPASGGWLVVLILVVVVGAPLVEELMYRGLLQGAFTRRFDDGLAVAVVAAWFAVIHFHPVEYPGLFLFGLVLGICALRTRRLGMGILAHMAFNGTGLVLVAGR